MKVLRAVAFSIATLLIYLGWPLLGWGLGRMEQFFSSSARSGYAGVVAIFSIAVGMQAYNTIEGIRGRKGVAGKLVTRQTVVRYVLELSLYLAMFFIPLFDRQSIGIFRAVDILRWIGVSFCLLGYGLIYWSGVALGRQYSADVTIQENHHLITNSIYHYIRHPRYLGIVALSIGISFVFRSWIGLLATLFFLAMLLYRIKDEESAMHAEFGAEWEAYCHRSWRLVPHLY
ncbi:MAG TPA: isoprenylcysteine carboxylmethyltransferase family protein [Anaerolineales bacterium]|nr:isoprenylcysteine carboxylmethyltransferase family protein [Anaerolineales bacterium]